MGNKENKIAGFDPNSVGDTNLNIFGLPFSNDEAAIVIVPVPWEVTVSYGSGTAKGPAAVFDSSFQVDLYDPQVPGLWKAGISMDRIPAALQKKSNTLRKQTSAYIRKLSEGKNPAKDKSMKALVTRVNKACEEMNAHVERTVLEHLRKGKLVGLLGGDHSTPLGMMRALEKVHGTFSVLQIDAHSDLREAYEGFTYSHASIMFNALRLKGLNKLVQAGIRDYCEAEAEISSKNPKVKTFYDRDIRQRIYNGISWVNICDDIVSSLGEKVYLSFDIDGLDPKLCPNTGTPVAGGFEFEQACVLVERLLASGRRLIAFDLNEISPGKDEWDANVGARMLYRLCGYLARSNGKA
ncbi:MAG: agmatinase family protein [Bacteroidia bacterium]|nr:agmatinase family protein [Bacteroidia bacterium]